MISQCVHLHGLAGLQAVAIAMEISDEGDVLLSETCLLTIRVAEY